MRGGPAGRNPAPRRTARRVATGGAGTWQRRLRGEGLPEIVPAAGCPRRKGGVREAKPGMCASRGIMRRVSGIAGGGRGEGEGGRGAAFASRLVKWGLDERPAASPRWPVRADRRADRTRWKGA